MILIREGGIQMTSANKTPKPSILDGVRILDFSQVLSGPYCTRLLADMGAEVIKVERPPLGDGARSWPAIKHGRSGAFLQFNAGKKGICLDLKKLKAIKIVKDLVKKCEVVVENFNVRAMARLGLSYRELNKVNPRLIMCSITGFGQTGPNKSRLAFATVVHAASGITEILRRQHGEDIRPAPHGLSIGDTLAGYHAAYAIMAALFYRERTGKGQYIDISMFDSLFFSIDHQVQYYLMTGEEHTVYGAVPVKRKDGYFTIGYGKYEMILRTLECIGKPELANDERFSSLEKVIFHQKEFFQLVEEWAQNYGSVEEVEALLRQAGLAVSKVCSVPEVVHSPQVESRGLLAEVDDPKIGKVKVINSPFKLSETESHLRGPSPGLGEHNKEILSRLLHYSNEEIEKLYAEGVLFCKA